jgi:hypothetical protein
MAAITPFMIAMAWRLLSIPVSFGNHPNSPDVKQKFRVCILFIVCALAGLLLLRTWPVSKSELGTQNASARTSAAPSAPSDASIPVQFESFEDQLRTALGADWKNPASRARRAGILIRWLAADRNAAMQFMAHNHFEDMWLPSVAKAIGESATASDLLFIANSALHPDEAICQIGQWASPSVINEFAGLMPSVGASAQPQVAGAVASLLSHVNLDRGIAFAMAQTDENARAWAFSGVFDEMSNGPDGDNAVRSLYSTLPVSIQTSDPVRFSYGNATWGSDPAGALQILEGIVSPQMRMTALLSLSGHSASSSPETAIAAVYASGISEQGIYNHVGPILQNWSAVDPQAAAGFLSTTQIIPPADVSKYSQMIAPPGGGKG